MGNISRSFEDISPRSLPLLFSTSALSLYGRDSLFFRPCALVRAPTSNDSFSFFRGDTDSFREKGAPFSFSSTSPFPYGWPDFPPPSLFLGGRSHPLRVWLSALQTVCHFCLKAALSFLRFFEEGALSRAVFFCFARFFFRWTSDPLLGLFHVERDFPPFFFPADLFFFLGLASLSVGERLHFFFFLFDFPLPE